MRLLGFCVARLGALLGLMVACGGTNSSGGAHAASGGSGVAGSSAGATSDSGASPTGTAGSSAEPSGGGTGGQSAQAGSGTGGTPSGLVDCDTTKILCKRLAPQCGVGEVPSVVGTCYGDCVKVESCACSTAEECPDPNQYTCWSKQHCGPFVQ